MKKTTLLAMAGALLFGAAAQAQPTIDFTGGGADITWYFASQEGANGVWYTAFRSKGNTEATGLTDQFTGFTGIVGLGTDWNYSALSVLINTTKAVAVGPTDYFISAASGSPFLASGTADLGIRTRLRENEVALGIGTNENANQFVSFNLTLVPASSTFNGNPLSDPGSPNVSLLNWIGSTPSAMINTATNDLTASFPNWDHVHRNWGFESYGNYSLAFNIEGVGGTYGATAPTGFTIINFTVIPEPSTAALAAGALGIGVLLRHLRKRKKIA